MSRGVGFCQLSVAEFGGPKLAGNDCPFVQPVSHSCFRQVIVIWYSADAQGDGWFSAILLIKCNSSLEENLGEDQVDWNISCS